MSLRTGAPTEPRHNCHIQPRYHIKSDTTLACYPRAELFQPASEWTCAEIAYQIKRRRIGYGNLLALRNAHNRDGRGFSFHKSYPSFRRIRIRPTQTTEIFQIITQPIPIQFNAIQPRIFSKIANVWSNVQIKLLPRQVC